MNINLSLMENNIIREDINAVIDFLSQKNIPILTQSEKVREFEAAWSEWLGVQYSLFVNSGSSANYMTMRMLREMKGQGEVIVPPLTWVSDISSVLAAGMTPIFADISMRTLGMDTDAIVRAITPRTKAVFLTHILGFNALTETLQNELSHRGIPLIEDVCESHGATFQGRKLGTFGLVSNFSFYYAHHLSTIEGGMICTDDKDVYHIARTLRSHGMIRECGSEDMRQEVIHANPGLNPEFIFAYPSGNYRSTEINAVIGLSQLKRLDKNNQKRRNNWALFLENLDTGKYYTDFDSTGNCNYALVLILKNPDQQLCTRVMKALADAKVEFRRGTSGGGNQLRQPYLKGVVAPDYWRYFPVTEHVHSYGFYIGNFPGLKPERIKNLCQLLNSIPG